LFKWEEKNMSYQQKSEIKAILAPLIARVIALSTTFCSGWPVVEFPVAAILCKGTPCATF
jgi:hypothetical protein